MKRFSLSIQYRLYLLVLFIVAIAGILSSIFSYGYLTQVAELHNLKVAHHHLIFILIVIHIVVALIGIGVAALLIRYWLNPFNRLAAFFHNFVKYQMEISPDDQGDLERMAEQNDEVGIFARSFLEYIRARETYVNQIIEATKQEEQVKIQLGIAQQIQKNMLPKNASFLRHPNLGLYGFIEPALTIGGDLYDFFYVDDTRICFIIGDVSDKGIPAALFMSTTRAYIQSIAQFCHSPKKMAESLNERLSENNTLYMFVTLFIGVLNIETGRLSYVNAGHLSPIFMRYSASPTFLQSAPQPVIGVEPELEYHESTIVLHEHDVLFLYTDGVTEAKNKEDLLFGELRLVQALDRTNIYSPRILIRRVLTRLKQFTKGEPQSDDIAMLCLCYRKNLVHQMLYSWDKLSISLDAVIPVKKKITHFLRPLGLSSSLLMDILLVIEEVLVNIISHAFPEKNTQSFINIGWRTTSKQAFCVRIEDNGVSFDPYQVDADSVFRKTQPGGFGWKLIYELTSDISYVRQNDKNILVLYFDRED